MYGITLKKTILKCINLTSDGLNTDLNKKKNNNSLKYYTTNGHLEPIKGRLPVTSGTARVVECLQDGVFCIFSLNPSFFRGFHTNLIVFINILRITRLILSNVRHFGMILRLCRFASVFIKNHISPDFLAL